MKNYLVELNIGATFSIEVAAKNEKEAEKIARSSINKDELEIEDVELSGVFPSNPQPKA